MSRPSRKMDQKGLRIIRANEYRVLQEAERLQGEGRLEAALGVLVASRDALLASDAHAEGFTRARTRVRERLDEVRREYDAVTVVLELK